MTFQEQIKDRLENGFQHWNHGYEEWLECCKTLYEPDAYYNIPIKGKQTRLTLKQYQDMCKIMMDNFVINCGVKPTGLPVG